MNPQNNELPSIYMSQTAPPTAGHGVVAGEAMAQVSGQPVGVAPPAPVDSTSVIQTAQPALSPAQTTVQPSEAAAPQSPAMPAIADDSDLIEKEWVLKAKQIVEETKTDPHAQNREMNRMKADYMKKRYNKDIKLEGA